MSCSAMRYNYQISMFKNKVKKIVSIYGKSHSNLEKYGYHLIEPIILLFGKKIKYVRYIDSNSTRDIVQIYFYSGLNVILEFTAKIKLPIKLNLMSKEIEDNFIYFNDFYNSFKKMLEKFILMVRKKKW